MVFHVVLFSPRLPPLLLTQRLLLRALLSPRFSLSLVKLIPTAEPGEPPASRGDSAMSSERVPSDGQKIAEREILLRPAAAPPPPTFLVRPYIGNNFDSSSPGRHCIRKSVYVYGHVALIICYTTTISSRYPIASSLRMWHKLHGASESDHVALYTNYRCGTENTYLYRNFL